VGAAFGLLHGILTVPLGLSQHVTGIGITLLATSLAYFTYRMLLPDVSSPPRIEPFQPLAPEWLLAVPFLGPVMAQQTALTWLALLLVPATAYVVYRTPLGLAVRTCGENPAAVEAQGLDVYRLRIGAVMVGSALMAVGGAFLTLSAFNAFFFEMVNGRGWICIALVVFASWIPWKALLGALLFGAFDAFQVRLQQAVGGAVPYQLFLMLPYLMSILALVVMARRAAYPQALMRPYIKGQR
jgi:simple sugar transport system permease protein